MADHTADKLAAMRREAERLAFVADNPAVTSLILEQQDEIEFLTESLTLQAFVESMNRFHRFDGIKDDMCPACGGRVIVDDDDPQRVRIRSVGYQRAS